MVRTAFPRRRIGAIEPLAGGLRNANFRIRFDALSESIVLRIYQHDASLCQKEIDLLRLVRGSVPVPEVLHAEPRGLDDLPPFLLQPYVEGIAFLDLHRSVDSRAIAQAAYSAGETLAAMGRFTFSQSGWLAPGPAVTAPLLEGSDRAPRFVDRCLASLNLQRRMPTGLGECTHDLVWSWAPRLASLEDQKCLVHGDFSRRNLLVRCLSGRWSVAAVLDWEFAVSASPLNDVGHFLRYERAARPQVEPHFSTGYCAAGGRLPEDWRRLARILDLTALCESLTRDQLPDEISVELVELVRAIVEDRDPQSTTPRD